MANIDTRLFKDAMGRFASGVTVITTRTVDGKHHGMTASAFCSLSLDPPLVLVCIQNENSTYELIEAAGFFGVNLLSQAQDDLSNRFAGGLVDDEGKWMPWPEARDKFEDLKFGVSEQNGAALLDGCLAHLARSLEDIYSGGDHGIFVGRVQGVATDQAQPGEPLLYFKGRYGRFELS